MATAASIQRRLARRAGLPAAVDPQPLVGVLADHLFGFLPQATGGSTGTWHATGSSWQSDEFSHVTLRLRPVVYNVDERA